MVVRVGPLPLGRRRLARVGELERTFATAVELIELFDFVTLTAVMETHDVLAVALDASQSSDCGQQGARRGALAPLDGVSSFRCCVPFTRTMPIGYPPGA